MSSLSFARKSAGKNESKTREYESRARAAKPQATSRQLPPARVTRASNIVPAQMFAFFPADSRAKERLLALEYVYASTRKDVLVNSSIFYASKLIVSSSKALEAIKNQAAKAALIQQQAKERVRKAVELDMKRVKMEIKRTELRLELTKLEAEREVADAKNRAQLAPEPDPKPLLPLVQTIHHSHLFTWRFYTPIAAIGV